LMGRPQSPCTPCIASGSRPPTLAPHLAAGAAVAAVGCACSTPRCLWAADEAEPPAHEPSYNKILHVHVRQGDTLHARQWMENLHGSPSSNLDPTQHTPKLAATLRLHLEIRLREAHASGAALQSAHESAEQGSRRRHLEPATCTGGLVGTAPPTRPSTSAKRLSAESRSPDALAPPAIAAGSRRCACSACPCKSVSGCKARPPSCSSSLRGQPPAPGVASLSALVCC
jgi:hypothetical protein